MVSGRLASEGKKLSWPSPFTKVSLKKYIPLIPGTLRAQLLTTPVPILTILADGKERTIQHMAATTFWSPDGKPMSAAQFIERLFGDLPELFKDEDELRELWSKPDTRKALLTGLEEKGYGKEQLDEIKAVIDAEKSDIYDVLAYISFALPTITREERVSIHKDSIFKHYEDKQQQFISFVLSHYISQGVNELNIENLPGLLEAKYFTQKDAIAELGSVSDIRDVFIGFQKHLYLSK